MAAAHRYGLTSILLYELIIVNKKCYYSKNIILTVILRQFENDKYLNTDAINKCDKRFTLSFFCLMSFDRIVAYR